jgi:ribonuclease R
MSGRGGKRRLPGSRRNAAKPGSRVNKNNAHTPNRKIIDKRLEVKNQILHLLSESVRGFKTRSLFNLLGRPLNYPEFVLILDQLNKEDLIKKDELRRWKGGSTSAVIKGYLNFLRSGSAHLLADGGSGKIFIHRKWLGQYLQEDYISAELVPGRQGPSPEAKPVVLLKRNLKRITGQLATYARGNILLPESTSFSGVIHIQGDLPEDANPGCMLVCELNSHKANSESGSRLFVRALQTLADANDPAVIQERIKASFNLPSRFSDNVLSELQALNVEIAPQKGRQDIRDQVIFTIDPEDAKDYDDAVSINPREDGGWDLGVHIADVSHFVRPGSAIDKEAMSRGCSNYLVGEVVPMLPHLLSNEVCSLKAGVDRYCFSAFITISKNGAIKKAHFSPTLIRSCQRFSYQEVQTILETFPKRRSKDFDPAIKYAEDPVKLALYHMNRLWRLLKRKRLSHGGLDFSIPVPEFTLDEGGFPTAIESRSSVEANYLIEEFMLIANRAVAEELERAKRTCVYRIHQAPSGEKLERFTDFLSRMEISAIPDLAIVRSWQELIGRFAGSDYEKLAHEQVLRAMMKAQYSTNNIGHFGLGFKDYAHFTSPIRRYPDLLVHRLLRQFLANSAESEIEKLEVACQRSNRQEIRANNAERESVKMKQVLYMSRLLGECFTATVRGVERFGAFVELDDILVEGLIPISELPDDQWEYNQSEWTLNGRRSRLQIQTGQRVHVQLIKASLENGEIDFKLNLD